MLGERSVAGCMPASLNSGGDGPLDYNWDFGLSFGPSSQNGIFLTQIQLCFGAAGSRGQLLCVYGMHFKYI